MGYLTTMTKDQTRQIIVSLAEMLKGISTALSTIENSLVDEDKPYYPLDHIEDLKTANGNPPKVNPANRDVITKDKEERTAAINQLCKEAAEHNRQVLLRQMEKETTPNKVKFNFGTSFLSGSLHRIHETANSVFYKITKGKDTGAVVRFSKKTGKLDFDGRFTTVLTNERPNLLAIVSNDADGRNYVRNVVRHTKVGRIYRVYRPKRLAGHFTHCDVYRKVSY